MSQIQFKSGGCAQKVHSNRAVGKLRDFGRIDFVNTIDPNRQAIKTHR